MTPVRTGMPAGPGPVGHRHTPLAAGPRRPATGASLAAIAAGALLVVLVVVPVARLAQVAAGAGAAGIGLVFAQPATASAVVHTVVVAVLVTAIAVPAGAALALRIERQHPARRRLLRLLVAAPLVVPEFVLGFGWTEAYGPAGLTDHLIGLPLPGLFGPVGIVAALSAHATPLAYLAVAAGLAARLDPDLEQAARAAGAGPWTTLRTVSVPLLRAPLLAAAALVFVSAVNAFAIPQVLGTPAGYATMSTLVYRSLSFSADPAAFADLSVVALAMVVLALLAVGPVDVRLGAPGETRRGYRGAPRADVAGGTDGRLATAAAALFAALAVGLPLAAVVLSALTRAPGLAPLPVNWTTANFVRAFAGGTGAALVRTVALAAVAAIVVPALGGLVAAVSRRRRGRGLATAVTLSFAVPGSALAVSVSIAYGQWLAGSAVIILVAYLAKFWALGHRPVHAALDRLAPDLTRAARASGAGPVQAVRTVVLPAIATALAGAAALVFLTASHELTMSSILYGPGSETLAVVVLNQRELGDVGATAALAVLLAAPPLAAGAAVALLPNRSGRAPRPAPGRGRAP